MNLIYEHSNGAKLYQCGALEIPGTPENFYYGWDKSNLISNKERNKIEKSILKGLAEQNIAMLILASTEYQPKFRNPTANIVNIPFADAGEDSQSIKPVLTMLEPVVDKAVDTLKAGDSVLSTCWAGINRSSLITGLVLHKLTELSGEDIIKLIREKRDKYCLCNETFYWTLI